MSGRGDGDTSGLKTRGGKKVIVRTALAPGDPRPALAMKKRASSSKTASAEPNASNNDTMEGEAAENAPKRSQTLVEEGGYSCQQEEVKKVCRRCHPS